MQPGRPLLTVIGFVVFAAMASAVGAANAPARYDLLGCWKHERSSAELSFITFCFKTDATAFGWDFEGGHGAEIGNLSWNVPDKGQLRIGTTVCATRWLSPGISFELSNCSTPFEAREWKRECTRSKDALPNGGKPHPGCGDGPAKRGG